MDIKQLFIGSEQVLTKVVNQINDDQWAMQMPPEFQRRGNIEATLREIINYHAYDDSWVPETLAGKTIEEVGSKYDGDLLGTDPKVTWSKIVDTAIAAVKNADLESTVHLSYGDWPAQEYLRHITSFRAFRAIDIARLIGVDDKLPDDLVQGLWDNLSPSMEEWRAMGVFGPAVDVPADAPLQSKLLGLSGRKP